MQLHDFAEIKSNQFEILLTFHNENSGNENLAKSYNQSKMFGYQKFIQTNFFVMLQKYVIIMLSSDKFTQKLLMRK